MLIATHVYIDQVGRISQLLAAGLKAPTLCSESSARLLPLVLEDALQLGNSRDARQLECSLKLIEQRIIALTYKHWFSLIDSSPEQQSCIRMQRTGHILGSVYVECERHERSSGKDTAWYSPAPSTQRCCRPRRHRAAPTS